MDEVVLVRRCQAGDAVAFEALFTLYAPKVLRTAYLITGDRVVAEEVMQETFTRTFRFVRQLREPRAFSSWLYRVTVQQAGKAAARERAQHRKLPRHRSERVVAEPAHAAETEQEELLWAAMQRLSENQRAALVLHYWRDQPVATVAALMGVPVGTVKAWLHRARAVLGRELGQTMANSGGDHKPWMD